MELKDKIPYLEPERAPTAEESRIWERSAKLSHVVTRKSQIVKLQYRNALLTGQFAAARKIDLSEPELSALEQRMILALREIESLNTACAEVENLRLGIRKNGNDLDIVQPSASESGYLGWIIPAIGVAVVAGGILARWIYLEKEVDYIRGRYNGILVRTDQLLCKNPLSKTCAEWTAAKKSGDYQKRLGLIDSISETLSSFAGGAATGAKWGLLLAIPLLLWLYLPRRKESSK